MKRTVKLTMEQANKLMKEDLSFDPNSIEAGEVSQLDPNTKINVFQTTGRGTNGPKVIAKVTPEVGKPLAQSVQAAAREAQKQNSGAQVTGVVTAGDVAKTGSNLSNIQNAGSSADGNPDTNQTNESRFSKKDIMEMRSKYLNENTKTYAKKDFYNRRNGR
jgi:hypothetical protein